MLLPEHPAAVLLDLARGTLRFQNPPLDHLEDVVGEGVVSFGNVVFEALRQHVNRDFLRLTVVDDRLTVDERMVRRTQDHCRV